MKFKKMKKRRKGKLKKYFLKFQANKKVIFKNFMASIFLNVITGILCPCKVKFESAGLTSSTVSKKQKTSLSLHV